MVERWMIYRELERLVAEHSEHLQASQRRLAPLYVEAERNPKYQEHVVAAKMDLLEQRSLLMDEFAKAAVTLLLNRSAPATAPAPAASRMAAAQAAFDNRHDVEDTPANRETFVAGYLQALRDQAGPS
ncbi:hypothetical protein ACFV9C_42325 [Kribbella sp. NPDC059898]|uniref:hypothetical protein n=1 Tax=Kribbella sp. NPDC059898 TaxID=3346995 RepID=UPI003655F395